MHLFDKIRIQDESVREWFVQVLRARGRKNQEEADARSADLNRQLTLLRNQQDRLLNLRLLDQIDEGTFAAKSAELRDPIDRLTLKLKKSGANENGELAVRAFELSQNLQSKWLTSDVPTKRQLLQIISLNSQFVA